MRSAFFSTASLSISLLIPLAGNAANPLDQANTLFAKSVQDSNAVSEGEIRKIDKEMGRVTIKHGELKNLDMPPMTMVFRVKEATLLNNFTVGDNIYFVAEKAGAHLVATKIELKK